ncbi:coagulation factor 5/8 type domain protein [Paenibacillus curdlanolyticus YK9]|uniref:Coagulation factor 5/8 type domain protein n=1 Tax=Paenibacillus curdlanolyticus YK9 TaxID=717606 RepID=E0I8S1_9BACL|nr:discoidin domain-containing protein [Paenibacillus curdlanolyticus]EFM10805.1 coagulation factor 5/8 type domain protein [Paenibacillus curdlanolyticus YK9]
MTRTQSMKKKLSMVLMSAMLLATAQLSITLKEASASGNLALGHYVWASSGSYPAAAVDGVHYSSNFWQPNYGQTGWITVDLGSVQAVNQIVIKAPTYGYWVQSASILTSNSADDNTFTAQTPATTYGYYSANNYTNTINLPSTVNTRYVRVQVANVSTATAISELEVYGP